MAGAIQMSDIQRAKSEFKTVLAVRLTVEAAVGVDDLAHICLAAARG